MFELVKSTYSDCPWIVCIRTYVRTYHTASQLTETIECMHTNMYIRTYIAMRAWTHICTYIHTYIRTLSTGTHYKINCSRYLDRHSVCRWLPCDDLDEALFVPVSKTFSACEKGRASQLGSCRTSLRGEVGVTVILAWKASTAILITWLRYAQLHTYVEATHNWLT